MYGIPLHFTSIKNNFRVTVNGTNVTHTDLCQKNFGCPSCLDISILFYFHSDYTDVCNGNENGIKTSIEALTDDNVLSIRSRSSPLKTNFASISKILRVHFGSIASGGF